MAVEHKISVVIPTYNRKDYLLTALESVFRQSFQPHEIIVVDDGSTDGTEEALDEAGYTDRIIFHKIEHQGRPAPARNHGIRLATGNWIALLDSDDQWEDTKLEKQICFYEKLHKEEKEDCGLIDTFAHVLDTDTGQEMASRKHVKSGRCVDGIITGKYINQTSSVLIKKEVFDQVGCFDENLLSCEDTEMWLRIAKHYSIFTVEEFLNNYRINSTSISKNIEAKITDHYQLINTVKERHADLGYDLINKIISFRKALLLQRIYNSHNRELFLTYFKRFFTEDKTIIIRSRWILIYLLCSFIDSISPFSGK